MDSRLQTLIEGIAALDPALKPPAPTFTLAELQTWPWEDLWIVGRSRKWPANSPHGMSMTNGTHPAITEYHPIPIQNDRDNLYRKLGIVDRIPLALMANMRKVIFSFSFGLSDANLSEAFEFECQRQIKNVLWNMAFQLKPGGIGGAWLVSIFDYTNGAWKLTDAVIGPAAFTGGKMCQVSAEFTLSGAGTTHDAISFNGNRQPIQITQPPTVAPNPANYFNVAWQPDANGQAAAYKISIDSMSVTLA
jgi:hypothetical protein